MCQEGGSSSGKKYGAVKELKLCEHAGRQMLRVRNLTNYLARITFSAEFTLWSLFINNLKRLLALTLWSYIFCANVSVFFNITPCLDSL